jgi:hypothetical protein
MWWSPTLGLGALSDIDANLRRAFEHGPISLQRSLREGAIEGGTESREVSNCRQVLEARYQRYEGVNNPEHKRFLWSIAHCKAIELMRQAAAAKQSFVRDFQLDAEAPLVLPWMVELPPFVSTICAQIIANDLGLSWLSVDRSVRMEWFAGSAVRYVTNDWNSVIEILAWADFNEDGYEDMMALVSSGAIEGTFGTSDVLLLTRTDLDSVLHVIDSVGHLPLGYKCDESWLQKVREELRARKHFTP